MKNKVAELTLVAGLSLGLWSCLGEGAAEIGADAGAGLPGAPQAPAATPPPSAPPVPAATPPAALNVTGKDGRPFTSARPLQIAHLTNMSAAPPVAAAIPTPLYSDGPIMNKGTIVPVFWGPNVSSKVVNGVPDFYKALTHSSIYDWLHEYAINGMDPQYRFAVNPAVTITPKETGTDITDTKVGVELLNQMKLGKLPYSNSPQEYLYVVHLPPGVITTETVGGSRNCVGNCGYHNEWSGTVLIGGHGENIKFAYAVLPDFDQAACAGTCGSITTPDSFGGYTMAISHEIIEAKTDPLPRTRPAWSEIADGCPFAPSQFGSQINDKIYVVQQIYSLAMGKCVPVGPVSPLLFDLGYDSQLFVSGTDWAPGQSKVECSSKGVVAGVSVQASAQNHLSRALCEDKVELAPNAGKTTTHLFSTANDRGDIRIPWEVGHLKTECGATEAVGGISVDKTNGTPARLLCRHVDSHAYSGTCRVVRTGTQETPLTGNWDIPPPTFIDNPKAECFGYVKGMSRNATTGQVRSVLCCSPNRVAIHGDIDGDGLADIVYPGAKVDSLPLVRSDGTGGFPDARASTLPSSGPGAFGAWAQVTGVKVAQGDFNFDGLSDVALLGAPNWRDIAVAFSNGDGSYRITDLDVPGNFGLWAGEPNVQVVPGDFNGDGYDDIMLVGGASWDDIPYALSDGTGGFTVVDPKYAEFASWAAVAGVKAVPGDFNGDGRGDVALVGVWRDIPVALSNGDGTFRIVDNTVVMPDNFGLWAGAANVKVLSGDFDGDGTTDIALVGGIGWTDVPVALSNGNGTFRLNDVDSPEFAAWAQDSGVKAVAGDYNRDGRADIALLGGAAWNDIAVALALPSGTFEIVDRLVTNAPIAWGQAPKVQPRSGF